MRRGYLALFLAGVLSSCSTLAPSPQQAVQLDPSSLPAPHYPSASSTATDPPPALPANGDFLKLPASLKARLDKELRPITNPHVRADRLLQLLFGEEGFNLSYDYSLTLTAAETFRAGAGNCVSLSHLVVAAARHVGLRAVYQDVSREQRWQRVGDIYYLNRHINVRILGVGRNQDYVVDLLPRARPGHRSHTIITDATVRGHHYNNLGGQALAADHYRKAHHYFLAALEQAPALPFVWANLGSLYAQLDQLEVAGKSLEQALTLDPEHYIALNSLAAVRRRQGDISAARQLEDRLAALKKKNPYYLARQAQQALDSTNAENARQLIQRALNIVEDDYLLELLAARIHLGLDNRETAAEHLARARDWIDDMPREDAARLKRLEARLDRHHFVNAVTGDTPDHDNPEPSP